MARLTWDDTGNRIYETGTKQGVLFRKQTVGNWYENGVAWNGLTAVSESPSGAEETALYADDVKYLSLRSNEEFGATVEAYTYPDEWAECDGSAELGPLGSGVYVGQQTRRGFGLAYVTTVGNDQAGNDYGHKLHLIYNAMASPSEKSYATINDSPEAITFSWELTTTPIKMPKVNGKQLKNSATIIIDSTKLPAAKMEQIEDMVFGTDEYKQVTPENGANPSALGYYVKDGDTYSITTDTTVENGTQYYEVDPDEGKPTLPTPEQVLAIVSGN